MLGWSQYPPGLYKEFNLKFYSQHIQEFSSLPTQLVRPWGQTNFFYETYVWLFLHGKWPENELAFQIHLKPKLLRQSFIFSIPVCLDGEINNDYVANIFTSLCRKIGF
jgi:hypothetical protein